MAVILILALVAGLVITLIDVLKKKDDRKKKINDDGQVVTVDNISGKMDQHTILLSASQSNNGLVSSDEDYYQSNVWSVYYDGTVEYYEIYNLSGRTSVVTWELTDEQFNELVKLLEGDFFKYDEDYESACDGDTWHYSYYNLEGEKLHSYNGYNYSVPVLLEISEILDSDMRDQAEVVTVEKTGSHTALIDVEYTGVVTDENADEIVSTHWTLYCDGWMERQDTYQIGGKQSIITWEFDDYDYGRMVRELEFYSAQELNEEPVDGENYFVMTYYDASGNEKQVFKATSARGNVFGAIYGELEIPEEGYSYIPDHDTKVGCTTIYNVDNYSIKFESINPGHTERPALFSTYFHWQDEEGSRTTIQMEYSLENGRLESGYAIDQMSKTTINGETYYYHVSRSDNWRDTLWLYRHIDNNSHMMIILETTGWHDQDYNWVDETDADIEDLIQDDILEEAVKFIVAR